MAYNFQSKKQSQAGMNSYIGILIALAIILLTLLWYNYAYAINSEELTITNKQQMKVGQSQYIVTLQYCNIDSKSTPVGAIVSSNIGKNIVALDSNIDFGECQSYYTKINAEKAEAIVAKLFDEDSIDDLAMQFENRLSDFESKKVNALQALRMEKASSEPNYKKIERLEKNIIIIEQSIKNSKSSIHTLRSLQ